MPASGKQTVTLVGAGPVGSLLALFLARRGFPVEIHERRPDMRRENIPAGRSINLAISTRGLNALAQIGLEEKILEQAIPMKGRMIHPVRGPLVFQPYGKDESQFINSISRGGLNQVLMDEAEATGRVRIHFKSPVSGIDPGTGGLTFEGGIDRKNEQRGAAVVIGTDGSASVVRRSLLENGEYEFSESRLDYGYKELHISPGNGGEFPLEKNALHIWPRGTYMLIALPNRDGSFTCTLFLPFEGPLSFASIASPKEATAFFQAQFPDAYPLLADFEETFFSNPTGQMVTVRGWPWNRGGNALLMGDAAHAIVPFFGQGMNCGFEDCTIFGRCLDEMKGEPSGWEKLFTDFGKLRKANTDAIAEMAIENFVEMRDKVADPHFLMEREVEKILQNAFPDEYISRYGLVTFTRVPYRVARDAGKIENEILTELCSGIRHASEVDLDRAKRLIRSRLGHLGKDIREASRQ